MSAQQVMDALFGRLPEFFKDEEELRTLWSRPDTRRKLLGGLAEKGFGRDQLAGVCKIVCVNSHTGAVEDPTSTRRLYGH
jgi:type I restriction enzyme R subunit